MRVDSVYFFKFPTTWIAKIVESHFYLRWEYHFLFLLLLWIKKRKWNPLKNGRESLSKLFLKTHHASHTLWEQSNCAAMRMKSENWRDAFPDANPPATYDFETSHRSLYATARLSGVRISRDFHSGKLNFRKICAGLPITLTMKMLYHSISALIYATVSMKTVDISSTHSLTSYISLFYSLARSLVRFKCETFMFFLRWNYEIVNARRNVDDIRWLTGFMHNSDGIFSLLLLRHHGPGSGTLAWWLRQSCYHLAGYSFFW